MKENTPPFSICSAPSLPDGQTPGNLAKQGYQRLAFGSIADAVKLLYMESPDPHTLEQMDFFCISEIRRPKDGAMEIKFFDRLRALERLELSESTGCGKASPFYEALEEGARALEAYEPQKEEAAP